MSENKNEQIRNFLLDIVKYVGDIGFEVIQVTDSPTSTKIEGINNDKSVVVEGELLEPLGVFNGFFGISNFYVIKGLCLSPTFKTDKSSISVVTKTFLNENNEEETIPAEILFSDGNDQKASYRLMDPRILHKQIKFKGAEWDINFSPSSSKISEFSYFAGLYKKKFFSVKTEKNKLKFNVGDDDFNVDLTFLESIPKKTVINQLFWPINEFLNILKFSMEDNVKTEIYISSKGVMLIDMTTKTIHLKFILPSYRK